MQEQRLESAWSFINQLMLAWELALPLEDLVVTVQMQALEAQVPVELELAVKLLVESQRPWILSY
jgi:hypothetical protein